MHGLTTIRALHSRGSMTDERTTAPIEFTVDRTHVELSLTWEELRQLRAQVDRALDQLHEARTRRAKENP